MRMLYCDIFGKRVICRALDEMNPGYERQSLQFLHCEFKWTVDHSVDHQFVFTRVYVRRVRSMGPVEMQGGRSNDSALILNRAQSIRFAGKIGIVAAVIDPF